MSKEQARAALDGDLGQYLSDSLEASCGLICLGYGESGMRQLSTGSKKGYHSGGLVRTKDPGPGKQISSGYL